MSTFGQDCPQSPQIPSLETRKLRVKLILEELLELVEASGLKIIDELGFDFDKKSLNKIQIIENTETKPDLTEIADAIADISYVNYGAANAYGIDIQPIEEEVHNSNMTKLFTKDETLNMNPSYFTFKIVNDTHKCVLVKNKDGKVQKSPSYQRANIIELINRQINTKK
jgi:predicted HAD superfamily Cof-like phosphohydrolase